VVPITLGDVLLALLIAAAVLALVRNLPGLLEVSLFQRLPAGERYAYATIVKYAVTIAGLALAFDTLGVGWSSIQWLVAAVGLGLGFGLQEIFANFVSGLIILFERPIRVGDTVTVGEVSGTVSKIRIRATWITSFDRKELVVPNKEFVTNRLVNWSLTDAVLRVDIPVGIAYGSDTELALRVLRRVAEENEHVLADPPPQALFLGFGDSALSFELRVFSPDVAHFQSIRHQLHLAVDRAFREAGIEIAFPQRDLHLRTLPQGWPAPPAPGTADAGSA
jgi:potassium efflux system protein